MGIVGYSNAALINELILRLIVARNAATQEAMADAMKALELAYELELLLNPKEGN